MFKIFVTVDKHRFKFFYQSNNIYQARTFIKQQ